MNIVHKSLLAVVVFTFSSLTALSLAAPDADPHPFGGRSFETRHEGVFNGEEIEYTARLGETIIKNDDGEPVASFYSTDYVANDIQDRSARPVIFIWNGGPIAASTQLHMAGFGPKRLIAPTDPEAPIGPPFETKDNTHTLLDIADLVFVDPAETGFSRRLPAGSKDYFYSTPGDGESIVRFIQTWLDENDRAASPVFVMGTSYGSIRAAVVAGLLAETDNPLDGVILFSQGVNLVETTQRHHNLVGYASNLSQLAAIAWFHGRSAYQNKSVYDVIDKAQAFAMSDYLTAIAKGRDISDREMQRVAERLSDFLGMDVDYFIENDLLFTKPQFRRDFMKEDNMVLASSDARYAYPADGEPLSNPTAQGAPHVHEDHLQNFLQVDLSVEEYRGFAPDIEDWDYGGSSTITRQKASPGAARSVFADYDWSADLVESFKAKPTFRLFIATGVYDTLTTAGPARMLASDVNFPDERVELHEYEGGHSFYGNDDTFERLADDLRDFITQR